MLSRRVSRLSAIVAAAALYCAQVDVVTATGVRTVAASIYPVPAAVSLSVSDVQKVLAQAIAEAKARALPADIVVVDRVGNVLAAYQMTGALKYIKTPFTGAAADAVDLENLKIANGDVPAAIAKAITAAYLSSGGNAFSTRTASMIVQQHFPPTTPPTDLEGGPLFGVQFSQLPCSDIMQRYVAGGTTIGPHRSPLGFSADPGGFPLYKSGALVGGVGVMADGVYGYDTNVLNVDKDAEEAIALAATTGYAAPTTVTADRVSINGTTLRFSDTRTSDLKSKPASAPPFSSLPASTGALVAVNGYYQSSFGIRAGQVFDTEASGIRKSTTAEFNNPDGFILTDGTGHNRFPAEAGTDAGQVTSPLTTVEVSGLLGQAFGVMSHARAGIRNPLGSRAQVSISVVDTNGTVLGIVRAPDAPVFGIDVSVQKARTVAFFSGKHAASDFSADADRDLFRHPTPPSPAIVPSFVGAFRSFLNDQTQLTGKTAFAARSIANLSRPFFPDGEEGLPNGPLSRPLAVAPKNWSVFATGLQTALILDNIASGSNTVAQCTALPNTSTGKNRLANGIQIFSGAVPIYRGSTLVGGIGVSGDGIDQDDMISFLGLYNASVALKQSIAEAPVGIRADRIVIPVHGSPVRLRYVNCPVAPFVDSSQQNVCDGK
ncbi:MAG TPA: heme-binding protein [Rhizomicrobium sp.]|jgi:uncharacterized protein GlcG (DUF336 family)